MNPFDFINSINYSKKNILKEEGVQENDYVPFVINRGLSYFPDTILYANEMNLRPGLDNKLAYEYYLNSIRPRKRFSKWYKKEKIEKLEVIMEYYSCSYAKAVDYAKILTDEQINAIRKRLFKGE